MFEHFAVAAALDRDCGGLPSSRVEDTH